MVMEGRFSNTKCQELVRVFSETCRGTLPRQTCGKGWFYAINYDVVKGHEPDLKYKRTSIAESVEVPQKLLDYKMH